MNGEWDLSVIYQSFEDEAYERDLTAVVQEIDALDALLKKGGEPQAVLEGIVRKSTFISLKLNRLQAMCHLILTTDSGNKEARAQQDRLMNLMVRAEALESACSRYIGSVESLNEIIRRSALLTQHAFYLKEMALRSIHMLPEALEPWMLRMSLSGGVAFAHLRDKLVSTLTCDLNGEALPLSAVRAMAYDPSAEKRKAAYDAEIAAYPKMADAMAACMSGIKGEAITLAEARGYDSVLDNILEISRMDHETLDAMLTAIREALPDFRRYLRAKAKFLGHKNGLPFYDLFAPVSDASGRYTPEEARALLVKAFNSVSPQMGAFIDNAFENNWIDMFPRKGKEGGAFCFGLDELKISRVLTNFAGSFSDVSTLAHELGHAWHQECMRDVPQLLTGTPMPLAETASIFNETMLSHLILKDATPEERFAFIESELVEATQTIVDIYSRFLFESRVVDIRKERTLPAEELCEIMLQAQRDSYGDGLDPDVLHPYMWACKCHYYFSDLHFYNFPYAFGLLFGKGVFAQFLKEGPSFLPKYHALLSRCGSDDVAGVAASAGIDVRSVDFWRSSLNTLRESVNAFCEMAEKRG